MNEEIRRPSQRTKGERKVQQSEFISDFSLAKRKEANPKKTPNPFWTLQLGPLSDLNDFVQAKRETAPRIKSQLELMDRVMRKLFSEDSIHTEGMYITQVRHNTSLALCTCCLWFPKIYDDDVSAFPSNPVRWTYQLNVLVLVSSLNLLYYNDISTSKVPQGAAPLLTSCHVSLPMLSCLPLLHVCGLGLCPFSGLRSATKRWSRALARMRIARRLCVSQSWPALLGGHQGSLVLYLSYKGAPFLGCYIPW